MLLAALREKGFPVKTTYRVLITSMLAILALSGCTKKRPYEEVFKEEVQERSAIDDKSEYLYNVSMGKSSRISTDARPYFFGDTKRVKMNWTKDSLQIIETERDTRYQSNKTNDKLVLDIPVDYIDYKCGKGSQGECTNKEVVDNDISWKQKSKFKFKFETAKAAGIEQLPILIDQALGKKCYTEVDSKVLSLNLESDALNIQIQRTYKVELSCLKSSQTIEDATVSATFHYSMVKVASVVSKDFVPRPYPTVDRNTFGFFATERSKLDVDHNAIDSGKKTLMNHWNPKRSEVVYYLSDEFKKSENSVIRDLTYKAVETMNNGLNQAGAKFKITLKDNENKVPGDLRNSMIVLVEDPVASNTIGYGPQTEDPVTGEIVSARTVMFLGTIKKFIKYTYDEVLNQRIVRDADTKSSSKLDIESAAAPGTKKEKLSLSTFLAWKDKYKVDAFRNSSARSKSHQSAVRTSTHSPLDFRQAVGQLSSPNYLKNPAFSSSDAMTQYKYLQEAKNCANERSEDLVAQSISPKLVKQLADFTKPWEDLNETEKQNVIDIILPQIWMPTLIHEMGHNLGLRHNFAGSFDPRNFYNEQETRRLGMDHAAPYSSVMDYGDDLKTLTVLGKYDIAALRFGYAGKVEVQDGTLLDVKGTLEDTISSLEKIRDDKGTTVTQSKTPSNDQAKDLPSYCRIEETNASVIKTFKYCTDENADINGGCLRFDQGGKLVDIVKNQVDAYEKSYQSGYFRHGRAYMSTLDDQAVASKVFNKFMSLRLVQEIYERYISAGIPEDSPCWEKNEGWKDLKDATNIVTKFFVEVIETPDLTCMIAEKSNPSKVVNLSLLSLVNPFATSCFEMKPLPLDGKELVVVGQVGKLFNSTKNQETEAGLIDVRGYWIDKLMATRALFRRNLNNPTFDQHTLNFADHDDWNFQLLQWSQSLVMNELAIVTTMDAADGSTKPAPAVLVDFLKTHKIKKPLQPYPTAVSPDPASLAGLPNEEVYFAQLFASEIANSQDSGLDNETKGRTFAEAFRVIRTSAANPANVPAGAKSLALGRNVFIAMPENVVALDIMSKYEIAKSLEQIDKDRLKILIKAKIAEEKKLQAPIETKNLSQEEKQALKTKLEYLKLSSIGEFRSSMYEYLLSILPQ